MPEEVHEATQVYHIDANVLLSFLWKDNGDQHKIVQGLFNRNNPGDLKIKINTFALGEVLQNLIRKHKEKTNEDHSQLSALYRLFDNKRLEIFEFENIDNKEKKEHDTESGEYDKGMQGLTKRINKLRETDSLIDNGDILNIAIFTFDIEGTDFKTLDKDMVKSQGIKKYLNDFNKKVSGIE
jgi:predicted nucleic acid-binding protein